MPHRLEHVRAATTPLNDADLSLDDRRVAVQDTRPDNDCPCLSVNSDPLTLWIRAMAMYICICTFCIFCLAYEWFLVDEQDEIWRVIRNS